MKNHYKFFYKPLMRLILVGMIGGWSAPAGYGQTTLAQGEMSIIGFNSSGNTAPNTRGVAFVTWVPLTAGTVIYFTDAGFNSSGTMRWSGEQLVTWTAPAGGVPAGTVITLGVGDGTASSGSMTVANISSGSTGQTWALLTSGDQVFAFQGSHPPFGNDATATFTGTLLYGVGWQGSGGNTDWLPSGDAGTNSSALPAGLTSQMFFAGGASGGQYTGVRTGLASLSDYLPLVSNAGNWATVATGNSMTFNATAFENPSPLTLINFSGSYKNGLTVLQWLTADEVAFSHFDVEKSTDAVAFRQAGRVAAKGNGLYGYTTEQPESTAYYRLKMVDIDGSYEYSRIIAVLQESRGQILAAYPNPAPDHILIESPAGGVLGIYDATGRKHLESTVAPGKNTVNIRTLHQGVYYGVLNGASVRFVKE